MYLRLALNLWSSCLSLLGKVTGLALPLMCSVFMLDETNVLSAFWAEVLPAHTVHTELVTSCAAHNWHQDRRAGPMRASPLPG